jgi:hypothetical protein
VTTAAWADTVTAASFVTNRDRHSADAAVVTSRAYLGGALFPSVEGLVDALRHLRSAGRTEDVVGLAIPLEGDEPDAGIVRRRKDRPHKRSFNLVEFLMTALDPHRPSGWSGIWAPGKNNAVAVDLLGDLTRWLVGVQPFRVSEIPNAGTDGVVGDSNVWILGRPNHGAAVAGLLGDAHEGPVGVLVTVGVPATVGLLCAQRLAAGDCILTTCETDSRRRLSDDRIMRKAGATYFFDTVVMTQSYGGGKPHGVDGADAGVRRTPDAGGGKPHGGDGADAGVRRA